MHPSAILLCLAILLPVSASGAVKTVPKDAEYFELWFLADITIAPDGSVSNQSWRNVTDMPEPILRALESKIAAWQFQPANVDGAPAETGTSLVIQALAIERPDGKVSLDIANVIVGPSLLDDRTPEFDFPDEWRSGYGSGAQVFEVTVPPGAEPVIHFGEYVSDTTRPAFKAGFRVRARTLVGQWVVRHERVAGKPVPARFKHVVYHCMSPRWCAAKTGHWRAGLPRMPGQQPVPTQSVTRLLTDVATVVAPGKGPEIQTAKTSIVPAGR